MSGLPEAVIIRPFAPADAEAFRALNLEWVTTYFRVEAKDEAALSDPEGIILRPGGQIFMAEIAGQTIGCVACCRCRLIVTKLLKWRFPLPHRGAGWGGAC